MKNSEWQDIPSRAASWAGQRISRRSLLSGIAKAGIVLGGVISGAVGLNLDSNLAAAQSPCPPDAYGVCLPCGSACITGGQGCLCACPNECDCEYEKAACVWFDIVPQCVFTCSCIPCTP